MWGPAQASRLEATCGLFRAGRSKGVYQDEGCIFPLVRVDHGNEALKMFGSAVRIQGGPVGPLFDEDEMAGVLLVHEQVVGNAQRFLLRFLDQFAVERADLFEAIRVDEVFCNDFEHEVSFYGVKALWPGPDFAGKRSHLPQVGQLA